MNQMVQIFFDVTLKDWEWTCRESGLLKPFQKPHHAVPSPEDRVCASIPKDFAKVVEIMSLDGLI